MKKLIKHTVTLLLIITLLYSFCMTSFAQGKPEIEKAPIDNAEAILHYMKTKDLKVFEVEIEPIIPNKVFMSEEEAGKLPGITTGFYLGEDNDVIAPDTVGVGYVIGRVRSWTTASNGYIRKGYKKGTLSAIGSIALSFVGNIPAMTVSTILSVVSLIASSVDTVSGETLITYRYRYRDGEGRWSSDPNQERYWFLGYRTGQRETFKHVIGGKLNKNSQLWTYKTKNYTTTPARIEKTPNYTKSNAWLAEKGRSYVTVHNVYSECPW